MTHLRRSLALIAAVMVTTSAVAAACPFCGTQGTTLTGEVNDASLVIFGALENANQDKNTTNLRIETVVKDNDIRKKQNVVTLPRFLPTVGKAKYLVFCGVFNNKLDPYRGIEVKANSGIVAYLKGALERKNKPIAERLRFAFDYLDNADQEVAMDAYKEFANADYKDYRPMAKDLPADKIAKWLEDPETQAFRFGLYGSLLGHCGKASHAGLLKSLLEDKKKKLSTGIDGLMAGYVMLNPKEGWSYTTWILGNPEQEFMKRYAALRTARFLWAERSDLVGKKELVAGVSQLLKQNDIADLAIEDLRKWGRWEVTGDVLKLFGQKSHDVPIIRRAIIRFALSSDRPEALVLLKEVCAKDPEFVKDAEELLRLEQDAGKPATAPSIDPKKVLTK